MVYIQAAESIIFEYSTEYYHHFIGGGGEVVDDDDDDDVAPISSSKRKQSTTSTNNNNDAILKAAAATTAVTTQTPRILHQQLLSLLSPQQQKLKIRPVFVLLATLIECCIVPSADTTEAWERRSQLFQQWQQLGYATAVGAASRRRQTQNESDDVNETTTTTTLHDSSNTHLREQPMTTTTTTSPEPSPKPINNNTHKSEAAVWYRYSPTMIASNHQPRQVIETALVERHKQLQQQAEDMAALLLEQHSSRSMNDDSTRKQQHRNINSKTKGSRRIHAIISKSEEENTACVPEGTTEIIAHRDESDTDDDDDDSIIVNAMVMSSSSSGSAKTGERSTATKWTMTTTGPTSEDVAVVEDPTITSTQPPWTSVSKLLHGTRKPKAVPSSGNPHSTHAAAKLSSKHPVEASTSAQCPIEVGPSSVISSSDGNHHPIPLSTEFERISSDDGTNATPVVRGDATLSNQRTSQPVLEEADTAASAAQYGSPAAAATVTRTTSDDEDVTAQQMSEAELASSTPCQQLQNIDEPSSMAVDGKTAMESQDHQIGLLQAQVQYLELELERRTNKIVEEERRRYAQLLQKEKDNATEQIQALQLRLYISETKLQTYQDALQQHVAMVADNIVGSPPTSSTTEAVVGHHLPLSPTRCTLPQSSETTTTPLYSRRSSS